MQFFAAAALLVVATSARQKVSDIEWQSYQLVVELRKKGFRCPGGALYQPNNTPMRLDCRLWRACYKHSADMEQKRYFNHKSQDGRSPWDRAKAEANGQFIAGAENIAINSATNAAGAIEAWKRSDGHCRNMMNPRYISMGIGASNRYWTQMFGGQRDDQIDKSCYPDNAGGGGGGQKPDDKDDDDDDDDTPDEDKPEFDMCYLGCYTDNKDRDLKHMQQGQMTVSQCRGACKAKNFKFFSVQYGVECWCDNTYATPPNLYKKVADSECKRKGFKDGHGGPWRNSVYLVTCKDEGDDGEQPDDKDEDLKPLMRLNQECWNGCKQKAGQCNFCGAKGLCCRKGWSGDPAVCKAVKNWTGKQQDRHVCIAPAATNQPMKKFAQSNTGVLKCPVGYQPITDAATCKLAGESLNYKKTPDVQGQKPVRCTYCGGCNPKGYHLSKNYGQLARFLCKPSAGGGGGAKCMNNPKTRYNIIDDIQGAPKSKEVSAMACQARCAKVMGCKYFSYWTDSKDCHLTKNPNAKMVTVMRPTMSGPARCEDKDDDDDDDENVPKYVKQHGGHCAKGWIGPKNVMVALPACAKRCAAVRGCGYFAHNGKTCALYTRAAGCPDDDKYNDYTAYRLLTPGEQDSDSGDDSDGDEDMVVQRISNRHGVCLDASERAKQGGKVHMWKCLENEKNQMWTYTPEKHQIKATHGLCLDASERSKNGGKVHMWTCQPQNLNQQWTYNAQTGQIKNKAGICLDASQREKEDGGLVHMYTCDVNNKNQQWLIADFDDAFDDDDDEDKKKFVQSNTGVLKCPVGYQPITDAATCKLAGESLGYKKTSDIQGEKPVACTYCGGCQPKGYHLSKNYGQLARFLCKPSADGGDEDSDDKDSEDSDASEDSEDSEDSDSSSMGCEDIKDKKQCKKAEGCELTKDGCVEAEEPESFDPEECEVDIQMVHIAPKGSKEGKAQKMDNACECAQACNKVEKADGWSFAGPKKTGKPGKCQCMSGLKSVKCQDGSYGGYFPRAKQRDDKKVAKKLSKALKKAEKCDKK